MTSEATCDRVLRGLTALLEEAPRPPHRQVYDRHLRECPRCSTRLRQLRRTVRLLRSLPPEPLPLLRRHVLVEAFLGRQNAS